MYSEETNTPLSSTSNEVIDNPSVPKPIGKIGFSITAMVCGIIAIILCCLGIFSAVLGIIAVSFGVISLKRNYAGRGMAIAGIVCGIIAIGLYVFYLIYICITGISLVTLLS